MEEKNDSVINEIPVDLDFNTWSKCVIFRVPRKLRKVNESVYTPQLVSIGPFHHGKKELKGMETHKEKFFEEFCKRTGKSKEDLLSFVREHCNDILASYAGTIVISLQKFEEMILRDSCFIFELFCRHAEYECYKDKDYILSTPWLRNAIKVDLILLENQLPFSFLKNLYEFANPRFDNKLGGPYKSFPDPVECFSISSCIHSIKGILSCKDCFCLSSQRNQPENISGTNTDSNHNLLTLTYHFFEQFSSKFYEKNEIKHFTDLVRKSWLPSKLRDLKDFSNGQFKFPVNYLYCATKLNKAGVRFAPAANEQSCLADVGISRPPLSRFIPFLRSLKLEFPPFEINGNTECLVRNVVALEQCFYPRNAYICNYVSLMSQLINTAEDVDFLVEKKIIKNFIGSNQEIAYFVNKLSSKIIEANFYYDNICRQLNDCYENKFNVARATLLNVYFKDLWTASSTVFGFCVLFFSISSTIKSLFFS